MAALVEAGHALAKQPVRVGGKPDVHADQHEGRSGLPGVGGELQHAHPFPLAGRQRQPGKSAEHEGAQPFVDAPQARQTEQHREPHHRRPADHAGHRPPDREKPQADPHTDKRSEQQQSRPRDVVQPTEENGPRHGLRAEHRRCVKPETRTPIGPVNPGHQTGVGELRRLKRRERQHRQPDRENEDNRRRDVIDVSLPERRLGIVRIRLGRCLLRGHAPWQFLNFLPLPHGHGSLRPTFGVSRRIVILGN